MDTKYIESLVIKAQNGDKSALNDLFNSCYNDIYYFALKTVKDENLAYDITQDTFVEIIKHINDLKEPAAFMGWAKKVAYSRCTRYFAKKKDVLVEEDEDGNSIFDTVKEDKTEFIPDAALDQAEFKLAIHGILNTLSEEQRSATLMYYFEEMSVREIAEVQEVSEGTIKSRLNYARKAIKAGVEDYEKKHNIKLHSISLFPLLGWLLGGEKIGTHLPLHTASTMAQNISAAVGTPLFAAETSATAGIASAGTATGAVAAETAAFANTAATVATGAAVKSASFGLVTKIIAGVVAAAVVVSASVFGISKITKDNKKSSDSDDDDEKNIITSTDNNSHNDTESEADNGLEGESVLIDGCGHEIDDSKWQLSIAKYSANKYSSVAVCDICQKTNTIHLSTEDAMRAVAEDMVNAYGFYSYDPHLPSRNEFAAFLASEYIYCPKYKEKNILDSNGDVLYYQRVYKRAEAHNLVSLFFSHFQQYPYQYSEDELPTEPSANWSLFFDDSETNEDYILVRKAGEYDDAVSYNYTANKVIKVDECDNVILYGVEMLNEDSTTAGYVLFRYNPSYVTLIQFHAMYKGTVLDWYDFKGDSNENSLIINIAENKGTIELTSDGMYTEDTAELYIDENGTYTIKGDKVDDSFSGIEGEYLGMYWDHAGSSYNIYTLKDGGLLYSGWYRGSFSKLNEPVTITDKSGNVYTNFKAAEVRGVSDDYILLYLYTEDGKVLYYHDRYVGGGEFQPTLFKCSVTDIGVTIHSCGFNKFFGYDNMSDNYFYRIEKKYELVKIQLPEGCTVADIDKIMGGYYVVLKNGLVCYNGEYCEALNEAIQQGKVVELLELNVISYQDAKTEGVISENGNLYVKYINGLIYTP